MSAERPLARLVGQHPAALRTVSFTGGDLTGRLAHLEIETKHGQVVVVDHVSGALYEHPPAPPGMSGRRTQRDLSDLLSGAFDGRPVFERIEPLREAAALTGWRFLLSTGFAFTFALDAAAPRLMPHPTPPESP